MIEAVLLALALAMDATAVAAARGVIGMRPREAMLLATSFGAFQAGMAALGWALGGSTASWFLRWNDWIAFVLLVGIGGKMLYEARRGTAHAEAEGASRLGLQGLLMLSVATSIDALAAGVTLPVIPAPPPVTLIAIGVATFALSLGGGLGGAALGTRAGKQLEILGGVVLIGLAIKTLIGHLA